MQLRHKAGIGLALMTAFGLGGRAQAGTVGDIQTFYYAPNPFGISSTVDAPTFVFENASSADITDGVFSIGLNGLATPDSFHVGTIAAHKDFILTVGVTLDRLAGHTFFAHQSGGLDTSDSGLDSDFVAFEFTGNQGATAINSGVFTTGASAGPSPDGTVKHINFLGGPGNSDAPCNGGCFGPQVIATLSAPAPVPEVSTLASLGLLLWLGMGGLLWRCCHKERKAE